MSAGKGDKPRNCFSKQFKKNYDSIDWNRTIDKTKFARCRWCDNNRIPMTNMAIMSYKASYGGMTGVCKNCFGSEAAEINYMRRNEKNIDSH